MIHAKADDSELCVCGSVRIAHKHGHSGVQMECKVKRDADAKRWNSQRTPRRVDPDAPATPSKQRRRPRSTSSASAVKREVVNAIKSNTACKDCGQSYAPYVMDFDHVRGVKSFGIGQAVVQPVSLEDLFAEIDKCDVVCSNCHRERTFGPNAHARVERETTYDHRTG